MLAHLRSATGAEPVKARGGPSPLEARIVQAVDARRDDAVRLLRRLVDINSGTMNFDGVRAVGAVLGDELESVGFGHEWLDGASFGRAGHLVAHRDGDRGSPHLLLIGHLDTVFELDSPFQRFELGPEATATGPGVSDMKGGLVVMLETLRALAAVDVLDALSITVVLTGDEELSGHPVDRARAALVEAGRAADIAIGFENGDGDPRTAVVARRGSTGWTLEVEGTRAHSGQLFLPEVGAGAVYEAARILTRFREALAGEPSLTFNPGLMLGGSGLRFDAERSCGEASGKSNVVADRAVVTGDLRALSREQLESARGRMAYIARQHLPGTAATLTFEDEYPPLPPSSGNRRLLALLDHASLDLGLGPIIAQDPRTAGAADVSYAGACVEMAIDGLGPGGGKDHTVEEWIDLPTLPMQAKRAAVLMARLASARDE
jgi:glutamate carboxypeptidase